MVSFRLLDRGLTCFAVYDLRGVLWPRLPRDFRFGNFPALFDGFFDAVVEMIVDEQQRYRFQRTVHG